MDGELTELALGGGATAHEQTGRPQDRAARIELIAALTSGGDSRLAIDGRTGTNKYLCPPAPAPELVCASSCTASPISPEGFQQAGEFHSALIALPSPAQRADSLEQQRRHVAARLLAYFGIAGIAEAILCPSGTDALFAVAAMLAGERPHEPITAILPDASETGAGVPLAVAGGWFGGTAPGSEPQPDCMMNTILIPLRSELGRPRPDDEVVESYAAAAAGVRGRPIVYLTHGTKTGLIAPAMPPSGVDVIVDACQARIEPPAVAHYIRQGWPVVISGSKFFGGPAFSGAVLFPAARNMSPRQRNVAVPANLGTMLRWVAALDAIETFAPLAAGMPALLRARATAIGRGLAANPALEPIGGLAPTGPGWSELPSIFTFAVRDPADRRQFLSAASLRPLYEKLAKDGVLLGQPVGLGQFGGLRIAVGARDLSADAPDDGDLPRLFAALDNATRPAAAARI